MPVPPNVDIPIKSNMPINIDNLARPTIPPGGKIADQIHN